MSDLRLTANREKFANLCVQLGNQSEAYRQAFSCKNMSDNSIHVEASKLANDPKVSLRIKQLQAEAQKRSDISKDEAIKELSSIVRGRLTDVFQFNDGVIVVKNLHELPDSVISCIESVKETSNGIEIKLYNKITAIDKLSKMLGWDEATKTETIINGGIDINEWIKNKAK